MVPGLGLASLGTLGMRGCFAMFTLSHGHGLDIATTGQFLPFGHVAGYVSMGVFGVG